MHNKGQRIHRLPVYQNIQLHQLTFLIAQQAVIKGGIAAASGFQHIEEIVNNFIQRHVIGQHHTGGIQIFHTDVFAAPLLAKLHNRADIILREHDFRLHNRLLHLLDSGRIGHIARVG